MTPTNKAISNEEHCGCANFPFCRHPDPKPNTNTVEEILKQFLKDFGDDGPINPLGEARNKLTHLIQEARIEELTNSFREFSKDVPFDERLGYYDDRIKELEQGKGI